MDFHQYNDHSTACQFSLSVYTRKTIFILLFRARYISICNIILYRVGHRAVFHLFRLTTQWWKLQNCVRPSLYTQQTSALVWYKYFFFRYIYAIVNVNRNTHFIYEVNCWQFTCTFKRANKRYTEAFFHLMLLKILIL